MKKNLSEYKKLKDYEVLDNEHLLIEIESEVTKTYLRSLRDGR